MDNKNMQISLYLLLTFLAFTEQKISIVTLKSGNQL